MLIGICGPEGAGKTMAAKVLAANFRGEICPFAGPLKRMIEALGVDKRHLYGSPADKAEALPIFGGRTARAAMQTLGTEWGRICVDRNFWVRAWLASIETRSTEAVIIADDVRFANEASAILERGGVIIRVIRSLADLERAPQHASEDFQAVPYSFQVVNDKCPTILLQRLAEGINRQKAFRTAAE